MVGDAPFEESHENMVMVRVAVVVLLACSALGGVAGCAPRPVTREVSIRGFAFVPAADTVHVGDTVRWSNRDVVPHTATARGASFDSGTLDAGHEWRYVARAPGTYAYQCALHPTMHGTLVVR